MRKRKTSIFSMLILALTVITSLPAIKAEGAEEAVRSADSENGEINFVHIVNQFWTRNNLSVTRYRNGDPIRHAKTAEEWLDAAAKGEGAWCYVSNDPHNREKSGLLYNWYAVNDPRGVAPKGWHVPTLKELKTLATSLGGHPVSNRDIHSPEALQWRYPHLGVERTVYFRAVPVGLRESHNAKFRLQGENAVLWSSSEHAKNDSWSATFDFPASVITLDALPKTAGASLRCVRD